MNILIVEDDLLTARLLQSDLEQAGHKVSGNVRTFSDAMKSIRNHSPDFAILDITLGTHENHDGIELAHWISEFSNTPFIFLTGHDHPPAGVAATSSFGYVTKPYNKSQLLVQIELVAKRAAERNNRGKSRHSPDSFYLHVNGEHIRVPFEELLYVQADRKKVKVHTLSTGENPYQIGTNLGDVSSFFVHPLLISLPPSLIINSQYINVVRDHTVEIGVLKRNVPLSANARKMLLEKLHIVKTRLKQGVDFLT